MYFVVINFILCPCAMNLNYFYSLNISVRDGQQHIILQLSV